MFAASPGKEQVVEFEVIAPLEGRQLAVVTEPLAEEENVANNSKNVSLGVAPPISVQCAVTNSNWVTGVSVSWQNNELYDALEVLPKNPMEQDMGYCLSNSAALLRHTRDGDLNIDNNATEAGRDQDESLKGGWRATRKRNLPYSPESGMTTLS